ncbi:mRNA (guanine-N7-)-methyltransferase [Nematocida sp. LUAm3]|nr:mRNA (guanine-N7-)-methyltransferase [Nematocida sp. LUAm3]KAI5174560.1 mRNA (guanine-N7-)-methyltransferase [Nematocida sp. LUAm2]KAI5178034.1 mRNA (guanine-N7-)-methyltransferase [Nematocida sp. LUAm1]
MDRGDIEAHYNKIESLGTEKRKESKIIGVREINNFIKMRLISKYSTEGMIVMDLGCGKGGDLSKLKFLAVNHYFGCDIAGDSLNEALFRASSCRFKADFLKADFSKDIIRLREKKASLVMAQFSFHYSFSDESSLDTAVRNVSENLQENGVFLLTVPNASVILRRYKRENKAFGNSLYKIEPFPSFSEEPIYNRKYSFFLEEAIEECPEYLVDILILKEKFAKYKIFPVLEMDFLSILNEGIKEDKETYKRMVRNPPGPEEIQIIELYMGIAFKKSP